MAASIFLLVVVSLMVGGARGVANSRNATNRQNRQFGMFSVVQFPNLVCNTAQSGITGTCLSASECTSAGGSKSNTCAAGFGVCCLIQVSTCGSTITQNNTYIQNPGFPSSYSAGSSTETCEFTIDKVSDDVCQVRLDFSTFSGFTVSAAGICTSKFVIEGQTGKNPPTICGTNTGYHMYAEFGSETSDTAKITITYGDTTSKQYNMLVQQIECDSTSRAPIDCVQYYTGRQGTIESYGWAGSQLIEGMDYQMCVRREKDYCKITWGETSGTSIDSFSLFATTSVTNAIYGSLAASTAGQCIVTAKGIGITIPKTSSDGVTPFTISSTTPGIDLFPSQFCGGVFGVDEDATPRVLTSVQMPFGIHLLTAPAATIDPPSTGFSLDYNQLACNSQ